MRNLLQDQLLKAGLVKKSKVAQVVREQAKQRNAKGAAAANAEKVDVQRLQAERAERDRQLAAERNAQTRSNERIAQIRQIIATQQVSSEGEIEYRFTDAGKIRSVLVNPALRAQLAAGTLVIVRHGDSYALIPRAAADKVYERDAAMIVLDHRRDDATGKTDADAFYDRFKVPDDLIW
ncbi:MAG: DUF2058 domain-containing protein [Xanthomonadaceae bacterium]|nr:DUF2058 domain-containing protein [Xanthomonadaceae bacterium]MDP2186019.1 DUF2058 domain-containing protein [Xanthomonadales bacterium]MDZ4117609.1 DUF2058 domain-containing protein [Xanthomonadaceae bacterium]MDZ4377555.1 DUF2058 domain-containing protein [Xanthomonadaceae bacterium]